MSASDERYLRMSNADFGATMRADIARVVADTGCKNPTAFVVVQWARQHDGTALHALFGFDTDQTDAERAAEFTAFEIGCAIAERPSMTLH